VTYRLASGGSVVEETLFPGTPHEMISMYHVVDGELVLTHYCAMANQPRMRLDRKASAPERLVFAFDGGTNFDPAKDTHGHSGRESGRTGCTQCDNSDDRGGEQFDSSGAGNHGQKNRAAG